ncbi:MAG: hypothetical protein GQ525_02470 [Draconibacterium sp.]|nr:hypothetical protein [Draconibacterium sp.]
MKKITVLLILFVSITLISNAKKDINAWKSEKNLDQQYLVFKKNLNYWSGSYFLKDNQLSQFYNAISDSIAILEKEVLNVENQKNTLQRNLDSKIEEIKNTQISLDESLKRENSIIVFGMNINKSVYTFFMYMFIVGLLVLTGFVFLMFKRSNKITARTKKDYNDLKEEFEIHKKSSLDRYTKINMQLHKTRMELKK